MFPKELLFFGEEMLGTLKRITILELAEKIKELTTCKSDLTFHPLPEDDPKRRCPDRLN